MSNTPLPEPDGILVVGTQALRAWTVSRMESHAAAVSAAKDAEIDRLSDRNHMLLSELSKAHADNAALRAELLQEHADHKETVEDAMGSVRANAALRAELEEWRFTNKVDELERHVTRQAERIKVLEDALRVYLDVYENVPDAIDKHGEWYQTEEAKLADTAARAALGDKT